MIISIKIKKNIMRYTIQSKVINEKRKEHKSYGVTSHDSDVELTVAEIKDIFKKKIFNYDKLDIKEEILYFGNKVLDNPSAVIPTKSGLEYNIILN
jgi:hypothetical protein